jgi:hypothetical protein
MGKRKRRTWLFKSIVLHDALLNAVIITTAYFYDPILFWILIITLPLLAVAIYNARQSDQKLSNLPGDSLKIFAMQTNFKTLLKSSDANKVKESDLNLMIGNEQSSQPYNTCVINIESSCTNKKIDSNKLQEQEFSRTENFIVDELSAYRISGGGLVWQIGPDYKGCENEKDQFNIKKFKQNACQAEVKMIELKLPPACKIQNYPHSAFDTGFKTDQGLNKGNSTISSYSCFRESEGMLHFLDCLREQSGGKPTGIRIFITDKKEFHEICYAIRKTHLIPDFMVVESLYDEAEIFYGQKSLQTGMVLYEALLFVSQTLQVYGLKNKIRIIAAGKFVSHLDIFKALALGADIIYTKLPGGNLIKYPDVVMENSSLYKFQNVDEFQKRLLKNTVLAMNDFGFMRVNDITLPKFLNSLDKIYLKNQEQIKEPFLFPVFVSNN